MERKCKGKHCQLYHVHHYLSNYLLINSRLFIVTDQSFQEVANVTLGKNGLKFHKTVLFLHWIRHYSHKMQTTVKCSYYLIFPHVIFTVQPENIRKHFDFREVQKNNNGKKFV